LILPDSIRVHYLDASVLVKIVADDGDEAPGRDVFRQYYRSNGHMYTSSFCVAECFSAFKGKFLRKKISLDQYLHYIHDFYRLGVGHKLQLDDLELLAPQFRSEAERLITVHGIDFVDAVQIVTLMKGRYQHMVERSQSILITADQALAKAARAERACVWECTREPTPV
jgi:predicted nucleic acid-binding protein